MFTSDFDAEVDESESATLQQYYREAMTQGYNFGFEVGTAQEKKQSTVVQLLCNLLNKKYEGSFVADLVISLLRSPLSQQWPFTALLDIGSVIFFETVRQLLSVCFV